MVYSANYYKYYNQFNSSEFANYLLKELLGYIYSSEGQFCIANTKGIRLNIWEDSITWHERSYTYSDGPDHYRSIQFNHKGYRNLEKPTFYSYYSDEILALAEYLRDELTKNLGQSYYVSKLEDLKREVHSKKCINEGVIFKKTRIVTETRQITTGYCLYISNYSLDKTKTKRTIPYNEW